MRVLTAAGKSLFCLIVVGCAASTWARSAARAARLPVIDTAGEYTSPGGACHVTLEVAGMGGFLVLTSGEGRSEGMKVKDVTGIAWVNAHLLVYTVSPIYGVPGVYIYDCGSKKTKRIVAPKTLNKAYPDGADFFQLEGIVSGRRARAYFYYAADVDKIDFANFRTPPFLFQVCLDGKGFRPAAAR